MAAGAPSPLRAAAERALCETTGAARITRLCPHCGSSAHGMPHAVGSRLAVSMSYAPADPPNGAGLAVVAWGPGPLGIDIEALGGSPGELSEWTRVEALAKAAGTGLRDWPDVALPDLPTRRLELPPDYVGTLAGHAAGWRLIEAS